jgi:aspartate kinase
MPTDKASVKSGQIVVQKYGGSSLAGPERILAVAKTISECLATTPRLVVVLSAMGKATDELVSLASQVARAPRGREMDLLLSTGEQVSISLLGLALQSKGIPAIALTAAQCGIHTDSAFNFAQIQSIDTGRVISEIDAGRVVILTGFQGITNDHEVTTLGRGGSDITAAAVAAALCASVCEIYTDVDGVLSGDPNRVPNARLWPEISYEEAIEMGCSGAKVLHPRAAELCMSYGIPIHVRSSFKRAVGTMIRRGEEIMMERPAVLGVSSDKEISKVTLRDVPDRPGIAARVFQDLAAEGINVRLIIQSASTEGRGRITFIIDDVYLDGATRLVKQWKEAEVTSDGFIDPEVANISIVGSRLASAPGLAARMFAVLAREGINIDCISSSEMKIACVIAANQLDLAVREIHDEFFSKDTAISTSEAGD